MNFQKKMAVVGGMVALVGTAYVGLGSLAVETAHAEDKLLKSGGDGPDMTTDAARLGYTFGVQIAQDMKRSDLQDSIDVSAIDAAFRDVFSGAELRMTEADMQAAQSKYQEKVQQEYFAKLKENADKSAAFIAANGKKKGVVTTDSGLQHKVERAGKGKQPTANDTVKVHYEGKLMDGTKFDSSYDRGAPADFPVSGVIPGFSEGLMLMKEGGKRTLYIPAGLAYGENGPPSIGPNQALVFDVELIEVVSQSEATTKKAP